MSWKPANKPSRVPSWVPGPVRWVVKWGLVAAFLAFLVGLYYLYLASKFDIERVARMPERSVILDRTGLEFAYIHGERRRLITREEIPEVMVQALRAREDVRFPVHSGIDAKGLVRATLRNIKDRSFTQGASTLTMQLARNSYDMRAKSLHRKLLEMALTLRIEHHYSKDEILTHYLNRIYFGSGCHGVEEAAQTYFGRPTSELNTSECAMLVGIIRGPHVFSPFRNWDGALAQRDEVFERMLVCGFLTEQEIEAAKAEKIRLVPEKDRGRGSSYVKESIRRHLQVLLEKHDIRDGGLRIHTSLDAKTQWKYDALLSRPISGLEKDEVGDLQAAVVKMDAETGGVMAMCGGRSYYHSAYNRAYRAKRDLGPAYEPFLSAIAHERGKVVIPGQAVQTGRQLGVPEAIRLTKRLGISGPFQESEDLYRGAVAASPVEMAMASSILANHGKKPRLHFIERITDEQGRELYRYEPGASQAIRPDSARDAMAEVKQAYGKTEWVDVTGSCRDAWGVRVDARSVSVIWLGYDQPKKMGTREQVKKALSSLWVR
ncbi:penicillin-binding protein [Verrucomicrobiaceae bacterium N1E253]|uniref:peptidoglycan glycosyltransferase n=1 Tax=Oceaniferula marina TaxID=2748318 RepID=A0A851GMJ1_9BACT|nr:transglycosylase domain-containing protein [Oceaniferula marina]NWK55334.1 penicillin-binding protein [Oceaniferula marina]